MSRAMFKVCSVFLSLSSIRASMMGGQPGMSNAYRPKAESNMIIGHIQSKMANDAMMASQGDDCSKDRKDRIIEGVSIVPHDPITDQYRDLERRQKCVQTKIRAQQELSKKVNRLIQETEIETKKNITEKMEKSKCVTKLDRANHECFIKNALNDFYTSVVWKVAVHDNVAQLWYHDKLVLMIVFEPIEYNIHSEDKECFTFFPTSNVAAEENALGHVVKIVGTPSVGKKDSKTGECRPCTDFLKENKTLDGTGMRCENSCDPSNILFTATNFKNRKKNLLAKSEAKDSSQLNKTKEE